ncbi:MAG: hypothetical protein NTV87_13315 [Ignavibacteriae bacterium]|nr:hypothetical protein [Ignavibacteriota bacterium]
MNTKDTELKPSDFYTVEELVYNYKKYTSDITKKKIELGLPMIDSLTRGLRPKEVMTFQAGTGIGKSAIIQNILQHYTKKTGELTLFFTLEMSNEEIFERMVQIEMDLPGYEVEDRFLKNDQGFIMKCLELKEVLKNFVVIERRIDINILGVFVSAIERHFETKAGLICIDHLLLLENPALNSNEYMKVTDSMKKIKSFALEDKKPVIVLSQVSRNDVRNGIDLYSGKGSGEIENSSNFVLSLQKITAENAKKHGIELDVLSKKEEQKISLMVISLLKNRRGKTGSCILEFERRNLRITESRLNYR